MNKLPQQPFSKFQVFLIKLSDFFVVVVGVFFLLLLYIPFKLMGNNTRKKIGNYFLNHKRK